MTSNALALAQKVSILTSSSGASTTTYANTTDLPTSEVTTGAMAYVSANNKLYMWNGTAWFNIAIVNQAPTAITGNQATYDLSEDGTPTVVTLVSTDPEGFPLTWSSSTSGDTQVGTFSLTDNVFTITPSTNEANAGTLSVTFSVTDGTNTETSVSSFILVFTVALWDNVLYSINVNDQNQIVDTKENATITLYGNTSPSNLRTKYASSSIYFNGTTSYLTLGTPTLGTTPFTFETWYYPFALGGSLLSQGSVSALSIGSTGNMTFQVYTGGNIVLLQVPAVVITANQWQHIALTYTGSSSNTYTIWVNGIAVGTVNDINTWNQAGGSNPLNVNRYSYNGGIGSECHMENLQILTGIAKYTTNFTVPNRTQGRAYQEQS